MIEVVNVTRDDLLAYRLAIVEKHRLTLDEFADRARRYAMIGEEWDDWDELQGIAFLLGDDQ